jgi:RimJ/RimL family protein N-acetyltransferase
VIPRIESERLIFREGREADLDALAAFYSDEDLSKFVGGPLNRDDTWRLMALVLGHWFLRGFGIWALEEKATGDFIGWCGLWCPEGFPEREVSWTLMPEMRGRGYATEAAIRARTYAYETLGWKTAISLIGCDNSRSIRVAERLGAVFECFLPFRGLDCAIYRHPPARSFSQTSNKPN